MQSFYLRVFIVFLVPLQFPYALHVFFNPTISISHSLDNNIYIYIYMNFIY